MADRLVTVPSVNRGMFFAAAPAPMLVISPDAPRFTITDVNDAYLDATMRARDDLIGRPLFEAFPDNPDDGNATGVGNLRASIERAISAKRPDRMPMQKYDIPHPDGGFEERWWDPVNAPVLDEHGDVVAIVHHVADATERGRAEAALRHSEERYRQIVEGADDFAIVTLDERGIITGWNSGAERIVGYSREEAIGQPGAIIFSPEDREAGVPDHEMNRASTDARAVNERWHQRKNGTRFWGSGLMMRLKGESGGFLKMFRDRTAEHEAEAALRESEARLSEERARLATLIDSLPVGVCFVSPAGEALLSNPAFRRFLPDEPIPSRMADGHERWLAWDGNGERLSHDRYPGARALKGETDPGTEFLYRAPDGQEVWTRVSGIPIEDTDGRVNAALVVIVDIDEQKRGQEALRRLNEILESQVAERTAERDRTWNNARDLLLIVGTDGVFRAVNPAWGTVLGWREDELVGRSYLDFIHPDDHPSSRGALATASHGELPTYENRYRHKDGFFRTISWVAAPEGDLIYAAGRDVTAERAREGELAVAQEALRQSQKMEAMGQLTGGVAHDFNNLLTPIVGSLDLLQRRGLGNEREQRLIGGAMQSAERAKTLVQRLLAFARRQPLQAMAIDLKTLVDGMAGLIGSTLGPKIDIRVELAEDLPPAKADPNQLEMAILNLGVNARDAMPAGGTLTISGACESVEHGHRSGLPQGDYVRLSVADTGVGMDEATRGQAVEPFFSTKGIGKGTGLGLSMVHGLTAQLGGGLAITSKPGEGTTIDLWLPIGDGPLVSGEIRPIAPAKRARRRALLVDDEELVRMSTAAMLNDLGYEVVEASSAEEALQMLSAGTPADLLVTDHLMPGMSGAELAREVRISRPELPILIVSGYAEVDGIAPDLPRLTKPFRNAELAERLADLQVIDSAEN